LDKKEKGSRLPPAIIVRLKFQKQSVLKFVSRTIPHSGGYKTPQLAAELFPKLALGFIPVILSCLLCLITFDGATAAEDSSRIFFDSLQQRLIADGFRADGIKQIYSSEKVYFETRGITAYFQHNEASLDYRRMITPRQIRMARAYVSQYSETFQKAENAFGVDRNIITAIILVESNLGRYLGRKSVINTLSTMAVLTDPGPKEFLWLQLPEEKRFDRLKYDQKVNQKTDWAYNELKAFLTYTERGKIDPISVVGSYAGALGIAQFIPSSILSFGQDGNGDGQIDLFNHEDAIFSIASYLSSFGWKPAMEREQMHNVLFNYNRSKYYVDAVLQIAYLIKE
jgi:membrane-bound lytic murein transglycosylase B